MTTTEATRSIIGTGASSGEHDRSTDGVGDAVGPGTSASPTRSASGDIFATAGSMTRSTDSPPRAVESRAAVNGHPIHPMLVPLPIGSLVGAALADVAYLRTRDRFWARSARHLTEAAIVTAAMAAIPGAIDFTGREEIRQRPAAWVHAGGNALVLGLSVLSLAMRDAEDRQPPVRPAMAASLLSLGILGVTGWLGGELSYRYRIGVTES